MPVDRFLHPRAGHSEKVSNLSDLEFRVWVQYILSADDFGVMRATALTLQADNDALAEVPFPAVDAAIEKIVTCGLVRDFAHQGRRYVFQHDWSTWQHNKFPRRTNLPKPPEDALASCDEATRVFFQQHPGGRRGGGGGTGSESSGRNSKFSSHGGAESDAREGGQFSHSRSEKTRDGSARSAWLSLMAKRNGSFRKGAENPFNGGRVYVPPSLHKKFLNLRNHAGADAELMAWYREVADAWTTGVHATDEPGADMFAFWQARYAERWPSASTSPRPKGWDSWKPQPA